MSCLPPPPFRASVSPGLGREVRNGTSWTSLEKTARSGMWWFRGALGGGREWGGGKCILCTLCSWRLGQERIVPQSVGGRFLRVLVHTRMGRARLSGHKPGTGAGRAIAPLMKPWCAEGDVPTAANLILYRGWNSCVGWHRDDEPLYGECGEAKLIVSVSFGTRALFKWKGKSCPDSEARSCWPDHGDVLIMDGAAPRISA